MNTRRVYTVGPDVDAQVAQYLGQHFYTGSQVQAVAMSRDDAFSELEPAECQSLVFLGHSNGHEYGIYSASAFAARLADSFKRKKDLKQYVEHVYLIGCDMGVMKDENAPLAQEISDQLYKHGFKNAMVHSIARPEGAVGQVLYVEVITRSGAFDLVGRYQPGYLNAFLFSEEDGAEYERLQKLTARDRIAQAVRFKEQNAFVFLDGVSPRVELSKPHNTFKANESIEQRKRRILSHPYTQLSKEQQIAVACLEKRRDYEERKKKTSYAQKINFIINQLKRAEPEDWQRLLKSYKSYLMKSLLGVHLNRKSNTLALIDVLCDGQLEAACKMVENLNDQHQFSEKNKGRVKGLFSRHKHDNDREPLLSKKSSSHQVSRNEPQTDAGYTKKNNLKDALIYNAAKQEIRDLIGLLNSEIEDLQQACLPFLYAFEVTTKVSKRDALNVLLQKNDLDAMQQQARAYIASDTRVMRSMKTTRVRELLDKIANHPGDFFPSVGHNVIN